MSPSEAIEGALRVLIVDQHEVSRAAIRALLRTEGVEVVADVADDGHALALGAATSPDVAIVDVAARADQAIDQAIDTARALGELPCAPTVVLTSSTAASADFGGHIFLAKPDICARELRAAMRSRQPTKESNHMSMQAYLDTV